MLAALAPAPSPRLGALRDDPWLNDLHEDIWDRSFDDTPRANDVQVGFGPAWKSRLGLITMSLDATTSYIVVNGLLRHPDIPELVVMVTVAHEMVHYAHGFGSPLPQRYKHPHRGGVVKRELSQRGLLDAFNRSEDWVSAWWFDFYHEHQPAVVQELRPIRD